MKTFEEIRESQYMYHGSVKSFDSLKPNRDSYMINDAIGSHFASDPNLAKKFANGLYSKENLQPGKVIKTKVPVRSKIEKVPQTKRQSDQSAIMNHVAHTVFSHPDGKELFKHWMNRVHGTDDSTSEELYDNLRQSKSVHDRSKFGSNSSSANTFRSYVADRGGLSQIGDEHKHKLVSKFLNIMGAKGVHGLSYKNTSPNEIQNVQGRKCYVLFHPDKHEHPYTQENYPD